jgi:signal transduction histidine kinase
MTTTAGHLGAELTGPALPARPTRPVREAASPAPLAAVPPRRRATGLRTPPGTWRWWETLLVGTMVTLLVAVVGLVDADDVTPLSLGRNTAVVGYALALTATVLLYIHWRIASGGPLSWLILGMAAMWVHALAMAGLVAGDPQVVENRPGMILLTRVIIGVGVLGVVVVAAWRGAAPDPLATGVALGAILFVMRYAALVFVPHLNLPAEDLDHLALIGFLSDACLAVGVAAFPKAPRWVRYRVAVALLAIGVAKVVAYPVPVDGGYRIPLLITGQIVAATVLLSLAIALVRLSIRDNRNAIRLLRNQLSRSQEVARAEQAQLHEIRATIAGISSAAQIISDYQALAPTRRARIRDMITAEVGRLERLTSITSDQHVTVVDLDSTLDPLLARLIIQGHRIDWWPGGDRALGRADDIAEIVNVLLANAVQHGRGKGIELRTRGDGDTTEIVVSDHGPGVPPHLEDSIFEWGRSGDGSTGEGIGLHVARDLAERLGGTLELAGDTAVGATFLLRLPAPSRDVR